jgi:hypothetical protein
VNFKYLRWQPLLGDAPAADRRAGQAADHLARRDPFLLGAGIRPEADAVPGSVNRSAITPDRMGSFPVICTELCGLGHALMRRPPP